jgi:uncharacterized protein
MTSPAAVAPEARLASIDVLRGLALFGVLVVNLEMEFRVPLFAQFLPGPPLPAFERWTDALIQTLLNQKAIALFSLLFGVGLAIQHERLAGPDRTRLLVRRMLALLGFGLIHMLLIWNGDILTEYAIAGLIVLPMLGLGVPVLAAAVAVLLVLFLMLPGLNLVPFPDPAALRTLVTAAAEAYGRGGWREIAAFRIEELPAIATLHAFIFPRTLALMLLGVMLWRLGFFKAGWSRSPAAWATATVLIGLGLVLTLARTGLASLAPVVMALGYATLAIAAMAEPAVLARLGWVAALGRMAFTNYVMQSVVLGLVFYGYGLGLFGRVGLVAGLGIAMVLYAAQLAASRLWLRRFRWGPLEWLWRTLMYGRRPL